MILGTVAIGREERARKASVSEGSRELLGFSEEQLRFLADSLPQIAWTADIDGYNDYFNARWFEYTGLTHKETYDELKSVVHPDDQENYRRLWAESLRSLQPYEAEYRFRRGSDGQYRWHLARGLPVRDFNGNVIKWFGTCTDIHAQKVQGEQLKKVNESLETLVRERTATLEQEVQQRRISERRNLEHLQLLQRMINALPMAAVAVNSFGRILHANEPFRRLLSIQRRAAELVNEPCVSLLREAEHRMPSTGWKELFHLMEAEAAFTRELTMQSGHIYSFEYIRSGIEHGGFLLLVRDVTQEKHADAVKAEFMSLVSHQLRTPLTAIRWALSRFQRMMKGKLSAEETMLLERSRESAQAMAQTIRTMLSISRVETGLQAAVPTRIDLKSFLQSLAGEFGNEARLKNIAIHVECPDDIAFHTDPLVLHELHENLLSNAIKYTPAGGSVFLTAKSDAQNVQIEVRDTGIGIPRHQQNKIFTKFFRGENAIRLDTQGTGLGLYLASRLAETVGGKLHFLSQERKGTSFFLTLPIEILLGKRAPA